MTCDNVAACSGARIDDTRRKEGITVKIVVKIIRPSETAGRYITYRLVGMREVCTEHNKVTSSGNTTSTGTLTGISGRTHQFILKKSHLL
ncbi:hypothetical protein NP493_1146g00030 [Ridgeia piscesae]|uniref:RNA polymerase subunit H/Rpb5 C-terminal domain-containing protein n=1 Tax=Ridgeia piscesae TaxID=27915 RepID=A0AAD9NJH5_RIDPI|nr:hypothetical protein NP493_1146g00030 [Ridgeia piscesae]